MRLIDADALQKKFEGLKEKDDHETRRYAFGLCAMLTEDAPTVEAITLPCKPGDTVFVLWRLADPDLCSKCPDFAWGGMGDSNRCGKTEYGFRSAECIEIQEWTASLDLILGWIRWKEFGRTVFPTLEEAEAALAKMGGEKNG